MKLREQKGKERCATLDWHSYSAGRQVRQVSSEKEGAGPGRRMMNQWLTSRRGAPIMVEMLMLISADVEMKPEELRLKRERESHKQRVQDCRDGRYTV